MKILNEFGITPTRNHTAAGYDFYIPNIKKTVEESEDILNAFSKSYKKSVDELKDLIDKLYLQISAVYGEDKIENNEMNILLLYLALDSAAMRVSEDPIECFVDNYLIFDANNNPGIKPITLDQIFFNSGIHTALDPDTAGIFFNKSGKGVKGWDIRACVVDEDYTGFVHLSLQYSKMDDEDGIIYCGDKITQMVVLHVADKTPAEELTKKEYEKIMSNSKRGSDGFGSSDEKH